MINKNKFTLVEILIAFVILTAGIVTTTEMIARSTRQFVKLEQSWANEHLLGLATEFYLTFGHDVDLPDDLLPIGFSASCEVEKVEGIDDGETLSEDEAEETIDAEMFEPLNGWVLATFTITLYNESELIDEMTIDQIIPETSL